MSETLKFEVGRDEHDRTLADVVRSRRGETSWSQARALCRAGRITLDGEGALDPAHRVRQGQRIELVSPASATRPARIEILHADADVVVVDKPANLLSVPFEGNERDTLLHLAGMALRRREGRSGPPLRVVQRLDKDTTGVLVFARNKRSERALGQQFRVHDVERRYLGVALGELKRAQTVESWLVRDRGDGLRGSARSQRAAPKDAKRAVTHLDPLEHFLVDRSATVGTSSLRVTLVACRLETGRQHQIRIHLAEAGHPLVGERVYCRDYDGATISGFERGLGRPLLHAETLGFRHPASEEIMRFVREPPSDFAGLLKRLARS